MAENQQIVHMHTALRLTSLTGGTQQSVQFVIAWRQCGRPVGASLRYTASHRAEYKRADHLGARVRSSGCARILPNAIATDRRSWEL